jgi:ATP-dependent RNA helicase DDX46/PRP5
MFSATFPKNVENLARKILNKPIEVLVGKRGAVCINVEQKVEVRQECSKFYRLLEILGEFYEKGKVLIFVDKQSEADLLFRELLKHSYLCLVLHGA